MKNPLEAADQQPVKRPAFKTDKGIRYTRKLFFETTEADKSTVIYTLKDREHRGYPSLYEKYMEMEDVTEWEFGNKYLDSYDHWRMLCECLWFKPFVERWRKELELKLKSRALAAIRETAANGGRDSYQANKILLEGKWNQEAGAQAAKRGRPTKDEIDAKAKEEAARRRKISKDFERMNLNDD